MDITLDQLCAAFAAMPMPVETCLGVREAVARARQCADPIFPATFTNVVSDGGQVADPAVADRLAGEEIGWWSMSADSLSELCARLRRRRPVAVLELGSGISTLVLASVMEDLHGSEGSPRVFSVDQDEQALAETRARLAQQGLSAQVRSVFVPLAPVEVLGFASECYDLTRARLDDLLGDARPELVLVDGPLGGHGARFATLPLVFDHLAPDALVLMDDALRDSELSIAAWWERLGYAVFEGILWVGKGLAVGRRGPGIGPGAPAGASARELLAHFVWHDAVERAKAQGGGLPPPARPGR